MSNENRYHIYIAGCREHFEKFKETKRYTWKIGVTTSVFARFFASTVSYDFKNPEEKWFPKLIWHYRTKNTNKFESEVIEKLKNSIGSKV